MVELKTCIDCWEDKPNSIEFFAKGRGDNLRNICKYCKSQYSKAYRKANQSYFTAKMRGYRNADPERSRRLNSESYYRNKADRVKRAVTNERKRMAEDPTFLLTKRLRCRVWYALCGAKKQDTNVRLLGCTPEQARRHVENQFKSGMSWKNYGDWHIDHIRPCSSFDLTDLEQQRQGFNYTNLQPLWSIENLSKGSKWDGVTGEKWEAMLS